MGIRLIIAEKSSVGKAIAAVIGATNRKNGYMEGNGNIVSWCAGHLLELAAPDFYDAKLSKWKYADLPILPKKYKHIPSKGKAEQLKILYDLMNHPDVDVIVNAADAGREGENIFRRVYEYAKCQKPTQRLWISSMEDVAIVNGFKNLKPGADYDNLAAAASCRECADWVVGMNCTRAFTMIYNGNLLNVGRVQSPTLAMIVEREAQIAAFVKEPFYTPTVDFTNFRALGERHKDKQTAENIATNCNGETATVTNIDRVQKTVAPPKLYDLTMLQRDANRLLSFTAQETLDYAQSLYEKKIISYPRTDAKYITEDMRESVLKIIGKVDFTANIDTIIGKVSDHHAIIPTLESINIDISTLSIGERNIYILVRKRLVAAISPKHVYEAVTVTFGCNGHIFTSKGKTVITSGWKLEEDSDEEEVDTLPEVSKTQVFPNIIVTVKEGSTTPPKHYTEDTLLSAMESAGAEDYDDATEKRGLGTPATRAGIIERIIKSTFVERQKKTLRPTQKGKTLIAILPDTLKSPLLTAEWENRLCLVQNGEVTELEFMDGISSFTRRVIAENNAPISKFMALFPKKENTSAPLGTCPRCGSPVREGKAGFFCDVNNCGFKLWKNSMFWVAKQKTLTATIVTALLKSGRVALKNLHSEKTGKKYDAVVILDDAGSGFVNFKLEFDKTKAKK